MNTSRVTWELVLPWLDCFVLFCFVFGLIGFQVTSRKAGRLWRSALHYLREQSAREWRQHQPRPALSQPIRWAQLFAPLPSLRTASSAYAFAPVPATIKQIFQNFLVPMGYRILWGYSSTSQPSQWMDRPWVRNARTWEHKVQMWHKKSRTGSEAVSITKCV